MNKVLAMLLAALLIALGVLIDRIATPASAGTPGAVNAATTVNDPATSPDAITRAVESAFNVASRSVVYVNSAGVGTGSGVMYDSNGDIVTNAHVVSGASSVTVTLSSGRTLPARVLGTDTADDLAVIKVNASGLPAAHFTSSVSPAEVVLAIGNPLGLKQSVTMGVISGLNRVEQEPNGAYLPNAIQTSAPINPGNSGGALVALNGYVVGIPTMVQTSAGNGETAQNVGFAIPSSRVVTVANQIIRTGKVENTGRAYLGVSATDSNVGSNGGFGYGFGNGFSSPSVTGALVQQVGSGTPASRAGVQPGDVITKFNGTTITSSDDLLTALAHARPGQSVSVTVNRNGSRQTLTVTLGKMPANQ